MKTTMLIVTLAAGLAGGSNSLADILAPMVQPLTVPPGLSFLSLPRLDFNSSGLPANDSDAAYFFRNNYYFSTHTMIDQYGWAPPLLALEKREAIAFQNNSGNPLALNNISEVSEAPWISVAAWKNDAASVSPTVFGYFHLLGYNGLDGGTFERIVDHIPHYHQYARVHRLMDPLSSDFQVYTFANGRWFPEAPVLNAGEGAFFDFGPENGPAVSSQISGVTRSLIKIDPTDAASYSVEVVLTGRFHHDAVIQLRRSYGPQKGQLLSPLQNSTKVSDDRKILRAFFDFNQAEGGDYDVLLDYPGGASRTFPNGIRLVNPIGDAFYHTVKGSTILQNNKPISYEITFQNDTSSDKTIEVRFYAQQVNQSHPNVYIGKLQTYFRPASIIPAVTLGTGGSAWVYTAVSAPQGETKLTVPLLVDSSTVPTQDLPLHYALEVSWREPSVSSTWSDPVWMPSFILE